jgi:hypothetical protein
MYTRTQPLAEATLQDFIHICFTELRNHLNINLFKRLNLRSLCRSSSPHEDFILFPQHLIDSGSHRCSDVADFSKIPLNIAVYSKPRYRVANSLPQEKFALVPLAHRVKSIEFYYSNARPLIHSRRFRFSASLP